MFGSPAFETRRSINRCGIQKRTCAAYASIIMCVVSFAASRWWSLSMFSTLRLHHELVTVSLCSLPWCHLWSCWSNFEFFTIRKALNWKETKPTNHHIRMMPSASLQTSHRARWRWIYAYKLMFVLWSLTNVLPVTKTHYIETICCQRFSNDKSSTSRVVENSDRLKHGNMEFQKPMKASSGSNHSMFPPFADHHSLSTSTSNDPFTSKRLFSNIPRQTKWKCQGLKRRMFPK